MSASMSSSCVTLENMEAVVDARMKRFVQLLDTAQLENKPYQYNGVEWCLRNEIRPNPVVSHIRGGFIADEMGLGKTITIIGLMYANFLQHTLIVVPPILIQQWFNEIYRTTGHKPLVYYGNGKRHVTNDVLQNARIVLTTYKSLTLKNCMLHKITWSRVVHDEAHHLRNQNTSRYKASKALRTRIRWIVSGTPIQNSSKDFIHLCKMIGFTSSYLSDEENYKNIIKHFVLRRTKDSVGINLPPVVEHNIVVPWTNYAEKNLVEDVHSLIPNISRIYHREITGISTIVAMLRTRQTCIMPSLIENGLAKLFGEELAREIQPNIKQYTAKLDCIIDTIHERKNNGKGKIVFCHYRSEIDFIYQKLNTLEIQNIYIYDGRNSGQATMRQILDNAYIVLLQIQTGCEGLNLQQKFSEIYFTTPHWNPFVEDQAVARCHRVGQKNTVEVFKFTMEGFGFNEELQVDTLTLEKYIHAIHERKRKTEKDILTQ